MSSQLQYQIFTCSIFRVKSTSVSNIHLFYVPCQVNFSIKYSPVLCSMSSQLQYQIFTCSMFRVKWTSVSNIHLFYIPCQVNFSIKHSPVLYSVSSQLQYQIFTCSMFHVKSTSVSNIHLFYIPCQVNFSIKATDQWRHAACFIDTVTGLCSFRCLRMITILYHNNWYDRSVVFLWKQSARRGLSLVARLVSFPYQNSKSCRSL